MPVKKSTENLSYAVWTTAWGPMGAVAGPGGLVRVVLPHYQAGDLADLLAWEHRPASQDSRPMEDFIELTRRYFNAQQADFSQILVDLPPAGSFSGIVLRTCRQIPCGQTRSYSQLAEMMGQPQAARAAATALSKNPTPLVIPCHRVIHADGTMGGFSAAGGVEFKRRLIDLENKTSAKAR